MRIFITILAAIAVLISCKNDKSDSARGTVARYALSADSARLYIARYDTIIRDSLDGYEPIRSFTVRAVDLLETLGITPTEKVKYQNARVYIGIDYKNHFRLFLTPVKDADPGKHIAGSDVVLVGEYSKYEGAQAMVGQYVLDFSSPCPTTCPAATLPPPGE